MNIAFLIYKRPDTTEAVFSAIRQAKPDKLFVIADAAPAGEPKNSQRCALTRQLVENVDWECEVHRNYADEHMGLLERVPSGLTWVFEQVSECIILEDDCLPHPSFFRYCSILLDRFRGDERIMAVSGDNFQQGNKRGKYSYYFSKYFHCWGWATWARAWRHFDKTLDRWPRFRESGGLECWCPDSRERRFWTETFDGQHRGDTINYWSYRFLFSCWEQSGLTVTPNVNLVSNIGFDPRATYSTDVYHWQANIPREDIGELSHPPQVFRNEQADRYEMENLHKRKLPLTMRVKRKLSELFG